MNKVCCTVCALPLTESQICGLCLNQPPQFNQLIAPFRYHYPLDKLILTAKSAHQLVTFKQLGLLFAETLKEIKLEKPDCLIAIPMHPKRLAQRGFNQSIVLAGALCKAFNIKHDTTCCVRELYTQPQFTLNRNERINNIVNAFRVQTTPPYRHIAIVDDVVTTGSTVNELTRILLLSGVERVDVWALSRASL